MGWICNMSICGFDIKYNHNIWQKLFFVNSDFFDAFVWELLFFPLFSRLVLDFEFWISKQLVVLKNTWLVMKHTWLVLKNTWLVLKKHIEPYSGLKCSESYSSCSTGSGTLKWASWQDDHLIYLLLILYLYTSIKDFFWFDWS